MGDNVSVRTAVVPVWLTRTNHAYAHEGCHHAALLWNELVEWLRNEWAAGCRPTDRNLRDYGDSLKTYPLHSHTVQAVAEDVWDAVETSRTNRRNGLRTRAPWRTKNYRPLAFTRNYGWRITPEGKLALSFGQGRGKGSRRRPIILPLPEVVDARTGQFVAPALWGEILLCWDRDARQWSLHIPYRTDAVHALDQATPDEHGVYPDGTVTVAVDEGVIHSMALTVRDAETNTVSGLVVSGREIRAIKRQRNKEVSSIQKSLSRCKPGSRKHKRLARKRKRIQAKTARQLRNADHHVAKHAAEFVRDAATDKTTGEIRPVRLVVGDVRGIEQNTKRRRRARRSTRQQLSQWSRGIQERYLSEKTGLGVEYVREDYTTQTCPQCLTRHKPRGRDYTCRICGTSLPRDVVGSGNIGSRADNGGRNVSASTPIVPWIDDDTRVVVTYQRAVPGWAPAQQIRHARNQTLLGRAGRGGKPAVEAQNRATTSREQGCVAEVGLPVHAPHTRQGRGTTPNAVSFANPAA